MLKIFYKSVIIIKITILMRKNMNIEFLITITTMIIGFISIFIMFSQLNHQINTKIDDLRKDFDTKIDDLRKDVDSKIESLRKDHQENFKTLSSRIDTLSARIDGVNARLDTVLAYLLNRNDRAA